MLPIEEHPFIALPENFLVKKIILGSFSCLKNGQYGDWFYLGSGKSNFWTLIDAVFETKTTTRVEKETLMQQNNIWITDVAKSIQRTKEQHGCLDTNLKIVEFNTEMLEKVLNEQDVTVILCTSVWVADLFNKKIAPKLTLSKPLPSVIKLPSPSPMADQSIRANAEFKEMQVQNSALSTWDYRLVKFKEQLCK
jgi:hypothetical protein